MTSHEEKQYRFTVIFEPAEEGGYTVTVPTLPGLVTEGNNLEEAREMVKDAIRGYIECLMKDGETIPSEDKPEQKPFIEEIRVNFQPA
ncbi:type II toxin-antitoxin system HicB family antitoxin [bacterium]|nr:type II toxin-antitoxin system HicB family antitoxin [bacterium]